MEHVRITDVERSIQPAEVMHPLTDALGATDLAINYYELAPGESFAFGYHCHEYQEEVFYIQSGTVTFETEEGDVDVSAGEVIRFPPGEFQRGINEGDERVIAIALGAPQKYGDGEVLRDCPECGERTQQRFDRITVDGEEARITICEECDTETGRWTRG
ncbi:MAG: cupin domain-containing protein [Halobacteriales archaeon]